MRVFEKVDNSTCVYCRILVFVSKFTVRIQRACNFRDDAVNEAVQSNSGQLHTAEPA
jgi:hypothetical protein